MKTRETLPEMEPFYDHWLRTAGGGNDHRARAARRGSCPIWP